MTVEEAVTVTEEARPTSRSCLRSAGSSRSSRPISRGHSRNSSRCQSRGSLKPQDASSTAKEASELEASTTFNESRILGESATLYETSRMGASAVSFALPVEEAKAQGNDRPEDRSARHAALVSEALVRAKQQDAARATMLELVRSLDESSGRRRELEAQLQKEQHSAEALRDNLRRLAEQLWAAEQREEDLKVAAWRARLIESTTQGSSRVLGSVLLMSHALAPLELLATEIQEEEEEEGKAEGAADSCSSVASEEDCSTDSEISSEISFMPSAAKKDDEDEDAACSETESISVAGSASSASSSTSSSSSSASSSSSSSSSAGGSEALSEGRGRRRSHDDNAAAGEDNSIRSRATSSSSSRSAKRGRLRKDSSSLGFSLPVPTAPAASLSPGSRSSPLSPVLAPSAERRSAGASGHRSRGSSHGDAAQPLLSGVAWSL
mmetsp:Transcript_111780/g.249471  ORF Transcript_111780/g.249471 Transcript_111780/m.249471 type:complete len:439 (+) Transcript_111780:113-1429(+)